MDCLFIEIAMRRRAGVQQVEYAEWPNESYALLFDHASRTSVNHVSLGNLVEQVAQVLLLNGQYALLQCLAVSAAKAASRTHPKNNVNCIDEGLRQWALLHRLRYSSLVIPWPWQAKGLRIWHPLLRVLVVPGHRSHSHRCIRPAMCKRRPAYERT